MRDPAEGLADDGTILTGVGRRHPAFGDLLDEVVRAFEGRCGSLLLYGSVATGRAVPGRSDVDLLVVDADPGLAASVAAELSERHRRLCRGVEVGAAIAADFLGDGDEQYGNRVFRRHYCLALIGSAASDGPYRGDRRAARGFNGDLDQHLVRWREHDPGDPALPRRIAGKTLLALAGLLSIREGIWTTDRARAVELDTDPDRARPLQQMLELRAGPPSTSAGVPQLLEAAASVVDDFAAEIGLWRTDHRQIHS